MEKKKAKRYFESNDGGEINAQETTKKKKSKSEEEKAVNEVITFHVKEKQAKGWGRKYEDRKLNWKKKQGGDPKQWNKTVPNPRYPVDPEVLERHSRGPGLGDGKVRTTVHQKRQEKKEEDLKFAHDLAARTEVLLGEESGYLEADCGDITRQYKQNEIVKSVDISAATKHFELQLREFGPYRMRYTRNGRHLLLGGKVGHVTAFDWVTKKLHCELNVMETVHDVCWLHIETMFAVAQKDYVYIYDNKGIELHCVKPLYKVSRMEFLPYHFLLATGNDQGYLNWLDVSIGEMVQKYNTKMGKLSMMTQNPYNAIICTGHSKGTVAMWSPNSRDPVAKMLCHRAPLAALSVDARGLYMATSAVNREVKVWDVRKLDGPLQNYKLKASVGSLTFSQKSMLAMGMGNIVEVYRDCCTTTASKSYLRHRFSDTIGNMYFCPFEDVLGVATSHGYTSLLIPGSGEPNFDALEVNPYQTKSQRKEAEVKALLEKIQPELITLDPTVIAEVDVPTLKDKVEMKKKLLYLKPPKINYEPRNKMKGKGGAAKIARNKKIIRQETKKEFIKNMKQLEDKESEERKKKHREKLEAEAGVFARFLPK